jgi:hypothetical protein
MTGPRSDRSAALLVGSTPSTVTNVQSAGQILRRLLAKPRWYLFLGFWGRLVRAGAELGLDRRHVALETAAVSVVAVVVPGVEEGRFGEGRGPEGAGVPGGRPAGLIDVDRGRLQNRRNQGLVRLCQSG